MAESVTILGMTFETGEVLTSAKMNLLAAKVDVIINGINNEAERAKAAEQSLQSQLQSVQMALNVTIDTEKRRAMSEEESINTSLQSLRDAFDTFYRGNHTNPDVLVGNEKLGFWRIISTNIASGTVGNNGYLLVVCDAQNTYQFMFKGKDVLTNGSYGAVIQTRQYISNSWSTWRTISGEQFEKNIADINTQWTTIDSSVLNKDLDEI